MTKKDIVKTLNYLLSPRFPKAGWQITKYCQAQPQFNSIQFNFNQLRLRLAFIPISPATRPPTRPPEKVDILAVGGPIWTKL